jgi:hypothetical protein
MKPGETIDRNAVIEVLERYNTLLMEGGFCDNDILGYSSGECHPSTIDQFLDSAWAKIHLPLKVQTNEQNKL